MSARERAIETPSDRARSTQASPAISVDSLEAMPFAAILLGADGQVLALNSAFTSLTNLTGHALLGQPFDAALCPETDPHMAQRVREALSARQLFAGELLCARDNGAPFWNDLILLPVESSPVAGARMIALFRDVTARHTAEHTLGTSAAQDRLLLDLIQAGIVVHSATGQLTYANAKATELLGVTYDAALGTLITDPRWRFVREDGSVLPIDEYPVSRAMSTRALVRNIVLGLTRDTDQKLVWLMGNAYPVLDAAENVSEVVVSFTDVTSLKQAERALQKSEERLRLVLQGSNDAPWDWDIASGDSYYSPRYWAMLGYADNELPSDADLWVRLMHPDDQSRVMSQLEQLINSGATTYDIEFRLRHKEGQYLRILSRGFILRDGAGAARRISGTNSDLTERRTLEERLQQSQKMEAIGQLAGGVAHDFNNLLAVIVGNLELVLADDMQDTALREFVREAISAAKRGADLTRRLLSFSRQQALQPAVIDVERVIRNLSTVLRRVIDETVHVAVRVDPELPRIRIDVGLLDNALLNLAINARDAMTRGGTLTIDVAAVEAPPEAPRETPRQAPREALPTDGSPAAGRYVRITVSDTGVGMTPEVAARALEPFYTTKPAGRGTGLGLSMVYGFVKQSGGFLTLDSTPGAGTSVALYFPVTDMPASADVPTPADVLPKAPSHDVVILVVEDDPSVRQLCLRTLTALGYTTLSAQDGPDALRVIERAPRVDLVLTDVVMPNAMSGTELAGSIAQRWPGLKVIYMSGYTADFLAGEAARGLSHQLLQKPFTIEELANTVRDAMATRGG